MTGTAPYRFQAVDVFAQTRCHVVPKRIEDHIQSLSARQFGCRNEVGITRYENNTLDESLICQCRNIDAELDVHAFLSSVVYDIAFGQPVESDLALEEP